MDGERMFIRFVSGEIDQYSQVSAGLFCAALELKWTDGLPQYEFDALSELTELVQPPFGVAVSSSAARWTL